MFCVELNVVWVDRLHPRALLTPVTDNVGYGYAITVANATQTVFARQSWWGIGPGLVEGDAEVDVDLPSVDVDGFDEEADESLALVEVELFDSFGDLAGEVGDAAA